MVRGVANNGRWQTADGRSRWTKPRFRNGSAITARNIAGGKAPRYGVGSCLAGGYSVQGAIVGTRSGYEPD
jgi:hypothetical protein